jgi:hypothetical protein
VNNIILNSFIYFLLTCGVTSPTAFPLQEQLVVLKTTCKPTNIDGRAAIYFVNDSLGYAAGYKGIVYKTIDSGSTWIPLVTNTTIPLLGIWFFNQTEGFIVGGENSCGGTGCIPRGGIILHTTNGGQSWQTTFIGTEKIVIESILFTNDSVGFAVGGNTILSTKNRGTTWIETRIDTVSGMREMAFGTSTIGYIASISGAILKTDDGGAHWNIVNYSPGKGYYSISVVNEDTLYVSGQNRIVKSINGGASFEALPNSPSDIFKIHFTKDGVGFAFGRGDWSGGDFGHHFGTIYTTIDGGTTWDGGDLDETSGMIGTACFTSAHSGYALGGSTLVRFNH